MASLQQLRQRFENLNGREGELAREAISDNSATAVDMVASQLAQGMMKDGARSDFSYAQFTIAVKRSMSGLAGVTDHLTNYNTGESYANLYMKVSGEEIEFGTSTDKEQSISDRMHGKAFGLTPDNKEEFIRQHVQQSFVIKVREIVQL